jgi:hypothetical protein
MNHASRRTPPLPGVQTTLLSAPLALAKANVDTAIGIGTQPHDLTLDSMGKRTHPPVHAISLPGGSARIALLGSLGSEDAARHQEASRFWSSPSIDSRAGSG